MKDTLRIGARGTDVRVLQTYLNTLLAKHERVVVDGIFGEKTRHAVVLFQATRGLVTDGIVGPLTWKAIDMALARVRHEASLPPPPPIPKTDEDLRLAGERAVARALNWWKDDIYDPKPDDLSPEADYCRTVIGQFIGQGLGWTWELPYDGDGDFEWCLAFAFGLCWNEIKPELRFIYGSSTHRMDRYGSYRSFQGEKNTGKGRLYMKLDETSDARKLPWEPRPGDIALVGRVGYGTHGVLIEAFKPELNLIETIEGNAPGLGPHGERQQGVVKSAWDIGGPGKIVRRIIRPSVEDLI